jgi:hypothetical protein
MLRPSVTVAGRSVSTYRLFGIIGLAAAIAMAMLLGVRAVLLVASAAAAVATFLGLALLSLAIRRQERLVYYHHALAVLVVPAVISQAFGHAVLPQLDVVVVALFAFLCWGRIGCWMVGCCHGRPHPLGLRYGAATR